MNRLTRAEEQIMKVLWKMDGGLLMEITDNMPDPKPHKNTVATVLKTMIDKGFVVTENVGRFFRYRAAVTKDEYSTFSLSNVATDYFEGSYPSIISFLVDEDKLSVKDLELLLKQLKKNKK
jgi:predicted transcriptional regulator